MNLLCHTGFVKNNLDSVYRAIASITRSASKLKRSLMPCHSWIKTAHIEKGNTIFSTKTEYRYRERHEN